MSIKRIIHNLLLNYNNLGPRQSYNSFDFSCYVETIRDDLITLNTYQIIYTTQIDNSKSYDNIKDFFDKYMTAKLNNRNRRDISILPFMDKMRSNNLVRLQQNPNDTFYELYSRKLNKLVIYSCATFKIKYDEKFVRVYSCRNRIFLELSLEEYSEFVECWLDLEKRENMCALYRALN